MGRFLEDHFLGAMFVLLIMGLIFGVFATYVISFVMAIFKMVEIGFGMGGISG